MRMFYFYVSRYLQVSEHPVSLFIASQSSVIFPTQMLKSLEVVALEICGSGDEAVLFHRKLLIFFISSTLSVVSKMWRMNNKTR